jgi:hypothetical protein
LLKFLLCCYPVGSSNVGAASVVVPLLHRQASTSLATTSS